MKKILFFLISCLSALTIPLGAQNVTISPSTGNLVAAVTEDQEVGFGGGWCLFYEFVGGVVLCFVEACCTVWYSENRTTTIVKPT